VNTATHILDIPTPGAGLHDVTRPVVAWLGAQRVAEGLFTAVCRHTSASLIIQGTDGDMKSDLETFFARLAPEAAGLYSHDLDGPDDMPAHIRAALTQAQLSLPVTGGVLALGRSQGLYLFEHRTAPQRRQILLHLIW
jgi:secondary thiamine-phosphate synthase enzyme